jgi:hypothetical protein
VPIHDDLGAGGRELVAGRIETRESDAWVTPGTLWLRVSTPAGGGVFGPADLRTESRVAQPAPAPDPVDLLNRFRASYRNYHTLVASTDEPSPDIAVETPASHPFGEGQLPEGIRRLVETYRVDHPDEKIELLKYMRLVNGAPNWSWRTISIFRRPRNW